MNSKDTAEARVAKGAALLDKIHPGWRQKIDTTILRMTSCVDCILGQLFGEYGNGIEVILKVEKVEIKGLTGRAFGFSKLLSDIFSWYDLEEAWQKELKKGKQ